MGILEKKQLMVERLRSVVIVDLYSRARRQGTHFSVVDRLSIPFVGH